MAQLSHEIAERKEIEATLRKTNARNRRLIASNIIGVFFWKTSGAIVEANDAFLQLIGYTQKDVQHGYLNWATITPPEFNTADQKALASVRQNSFCTPYEKDYICKNGHRVSVLVAGAFLDNSQEDGVAFVMDLSELKQAEARIRYLAHHDPLTGLPNRSLLKDRIAQAIAQTGRNTRNHVAVLFIDLDHFKHINDSLGHQVGDQLLKMVSIRLQQYLRPADSVARLGGDEFVITLAISNEHHAAMLAQRTLDAIQQSFIVDGHELNVSASIGISLYPSDGDNAEKLMRSADIAMYHAKENGRCNYQFFTPALNEVVQRRLNLANKLHYAISHNELEVHYQPQVNMESGKIFSMEALLRWRQGNSAPVSCSHFIRIAEETGLILPIGEWVLREACLQLMHWRTNGYPDLRVAVNLSVRQCYQPNFPELVAKIIKDAGLPATALDLEITESTLMQPSQDNLTLLSKLADMGIRLSIDDFGIGYSNLSYLQRFPIHALKIDRSFVSSIGQNTGQTAIVTAIIALAQNLRLAVIAEGVENHEQVEFLKKHGCMAAQGFYYSAPLTADAFSTLLATTFPSSPTAPLNINHV